MTGRIRGGNENTGMRYFSLLGEGVRACLPRAQVRISVCNWCHWLIVTWGMTYAPAWCSLECHGEYCRSSLCIISPPEGHAPEGHARGCTAVKRLDSRDTSSTGISDATGHPQRVLIVSESGMYDLVLDSRKPNAKEFRRWMTMESTARHPSNHRRVKESGARKLAPLFR